MLYRFRKYWHLRKLKEQLRKESVSHDTVEFAKASFVGLLYDAGDPEYIVAVTRFAESLRNAGKRVHTLGYIDKSDDKLHRNDYIFDRKSLNGLLQPQSKEVADFIETPFDILINLYNWECLPLEFISARSRASCRIGFFREGKNYCADIILRSADTSNVDDLAEQSLRYLRQIRK